MTARKLSKEQVMTARELLKGPEQNQLYFTGDFGFVVRGFEFETWFQIHELEGRNSDLIMFPIKPEALELIEEFILWAEEKDFDFGIIEKEDYEFEHKRRDYVLPGKSIVVLCEDDAGVRHLTSYIEKFWKQDCYGTNGEKVGFSGSKQYFEKGKENG